MFRLPLVLERVVLCISATFPFPAVVVAAHNSALGLPVYECLSRLSVRSERAAPLVLYPRARRSDERATVYHLHPDSIPARPPVSFAVSATILRVKGNANYATFTYGRRAGLTCVVENEHTLLGSLPHLRYTPALTCPLIS